MSALPPASDTEPKKTLKRDVLRSMEQKAQKIWEERHSFEVNAPTIEEEPDLDVEALHKKYPKFFATFPYPYMNGRLHLGHTFTFTKVEFATGYERLKGRRALFPFGFHCTGMPIKACADKLAREIEQFGPEFIVPEEIENDVQNLSLKDEKVVKKPGKVAAKSTGAKYQHQIMRSNGVPNEEIAKFADPMHWLSYFPPLAIQDIKALGCKVDWRRSFLTTDANPFYDSFARWQFRKLKELQKVKFGKRYTIYSPLDGQPCMDHDRASGEGVGPQEYTGIKMRVVEFGDNAKEYIKSNPALEGKNIFLVAATLRPETMYGQTNCFVGTELEYGFFEVNDTDVFVVTERAARNMCFQGFSKQEGVHVKLGSIKGEQLVGTKVKAPLSVYDHVYVLPMENVLATKGTGVVTSVPSDSPDDYATLQDLIKKPAYYKIEPSWVETFEPVPIIETPNFGNLCAPTICKQKKINSQKDKVQLAEAKEIAYKEGFYSGVMLIGEYKGRTVQQAKPLIRDYLVAQNEGFVYNEPEGLVISRSGDECVVNLCDQWYLDYGEEAWKAQAEECVSKMNTYCEETRNQFEKTLDWLNKWACARSFGLGSKLPWDEQFLIESLSDSTIYMAYYTVAQMLHNGSLRGTELGPAQIRPEQLTDSVWDYLFCDAPMPTDTEIPELTLKALKREFDYFYPLDVRVSGKDLVPNHLTFAIYNHVAIFPKHNWPKGIRANGHLLLNREKMSKSTGNFLTLSDALEKFGADATRLALADAGDSVEDANFEEATANAAILRLHTLMEWIEEVVAKAGELRTGPMDSFHDRVFLAEMNKLVNLTDAAYSNMLFREALKNGFYEFQTARDWYREATASEGMHHDLVMRFIELQTLLLSPITPHWSEYIWTDVLKKPQPIVESLWPEVPAENDEPVLMAAEYVRKLIKTVRDNEIALNKKKGKKGKNADTYDPTKPKLLKIFVASKFPEWQDAGISILQEAYNTETASVDDAMVKQTLAKQGLLKDKKMMPFIQEIKKRVLAFGPQAFNRTLLFKEFDTLTSVQTYLKKCLGFDEVEIISTDGQIEEADQKAAEASIPGEPSFAFRNIEA
ncbi:leucyl-tRNA synthetase [Basidiobolus meristosporus CBS 931.73]|uniref:leucine--tRNA ligase n=1 Tax=Basidiobolus meristosporus CBS 931.73 TaxID=1314790 RepID=A0A1Y1XUR0_9FUNG|nr:leucyl-tRNA synthetase [Basidiobolus meristosporus CBS 931.73]|eukprot:ORX89488.1 leucyl-tRNA synthetase [Basidiobolus meristosporus CBS 931.73]